MSPRKNFSSGRTRNEKAKKSFGGKKSFGDKPAFKKRYNSESGFSKDRDEKRSFKPGPSSRGPRPDDKERKPFRRPEGKFGDSRRTDDAKPFNGRNHTKADRRADDDTRAPRAPFSRDARPDDRERQPFGRPEKKFDGDRRRDDERPARAPFPRESRSDDRERKPFRRAESSFGDDRRERKREDRPERTSDEVKPPKETYSPGTRGADWERKAALRKPRKFGDDRRKDNSRAPEERERKAGGDERPSRSSASRPDDRERKPFRKTAGAFGDDKRAPRPRTTRDAGEGDRKWNRKSDSEFYGDRRKSGLRAGGGFRKKSFDKSAQEDDGTIRLNKFISNAGICSRREADEMIEAGVVSVNGEVMTQLGYKVKPEDVVRYNNETLKSEKMVYLLVNKPKDFITTADDPEKRKTVMGLVANACRERVYPVGRLDRNTTGLLLMTNDGDLTRKLTHPSFEVQKIYQVELDKTFKQADMDTLEKGLHLSDGFIKVDAVSFVGTGDDKKLLGVELHSGRNRIVRRIFEHLGYEVKKLDRVYFAGLSKKDLPRGRWRFLTDLEVASLKIMTGSKKFKNLAPVEESEELE